MNTYLIATSLDELRPEANALTFTNLVRTLLRVLGETIPTP